MLRIDTRERRLRLARRHHLAPEARAADPAGAACSLVAVHATDPASAILGLVARTAAASVADVEQALYQDRSLVRMLGMRRTVFVVPAELAPVVHAASTRAIAAQERRRLIQVIEAGGVATDGASWLAQVEDETITALARRGEALGQELSHDVPALRTTVIYGDGTKSWGGPVALTTRILSVMAAEGRMVRGRPRGSWVSSQHRWALGPPWRTGATEPPVDRARVDLARRWLATYGPATLADLKWWTGWTLGETRKALAGVAPVEVALDGGGTALVLPGDEAPVSPTTEGWVALLPALDSTVMGWAERTWFFGDAQHQVGHFDRSGNAGPTVWCDGEVVGAWAQRRDGSIAVRLLRQRQVGRESRVAIDDAAEGLRRVIGEVRVTPRFRTPLERELAA